LGTDLKKLAVALTGSHGVGKTHIVTELTKRAVDHGVGVVVVESPTRHVKSLGFGNNLDLDYRTEIMCLALRIERQRVALQMVKDSQNFEKFLILADRCALDELSYTSEATTRPASTNVVSTLIGGEGDKVHKLSQLYSLFYDFVVDDLFEFWDWVFYKPPHPDHLPEADGDRLADRLYQLDVDNQMRFHFEKARLLDNLPRSKFERLNTDRDVAVEQIWDNITKELEIDNR